MKLQIIAALLSLGTLVVAQNSECGKNQVYNTCGSCETTCEDVRTNAGPKVCTMECRVGCQCASGHYRDSNGACVNRRQCLRKQENEEDNPCSPNPCPGSDQKCVPESKNCITTPCPQFRCEDKESECAKNEVFKTCGSCEATCEDLRTNAGPKMCTMECRVGCQCARGLYRDSNRGCVSRRQCLRQQGDQRRLGDECSSNPCRYGEKCVKEPKQCLAAPCPQYRCEKNRRSVSSGNVCSLRSKTGPCKAAFRRWFFDSAEGQCKRFTYGGCRGNGNNFRSRDLCEARCLTD